MLEAQRNLNTPFYVLLSLPATAMGFALAVQISSLSWILTTQYGLDIHDVGLVWAAGPIAGIVGQVLIGLLSDKVWFWGGRRKPFIFIGGLCACLMLLAMPSIDVIADSLGIEAILGVAIAIALGLDLSINISFNPTRSVIADVTPAGVKRTKGFTWMQTISGIFGVMAYGIGAIWNNYVLIYIGAFLVLFFSIVPALLIEEPRELEVDNKNSQQQLDIKNIVLAIQPLWGLVIYCFYAMYLRLTGGSFSVFYVEAVCLVMTIFFMVKSLMTKKRDVLPVFRKICTAHSLSWVAVQSMFVYMIAFVQQANPALEDVQIGQVMSMSFLLFNAVGAIVPAFFLEPCSRIIGRVRTHAASLAIMAVGYAGLIIWGEHRWVLYVLMALCGIGWGAIVSLPFAIVSQQVNSQQMGLFMGLFNLSVVLPQLFVSLGVGLLVSQVADKSVIFMISASAIALSVIAWLFVKEETN